MESNSATTSWSEDDISKIKDYYEFCKQMTEYCNYTKSLIEKAEAVGPLDRTEVNTDIKIPNVPKYNILNILCKHTPQPAGPQAIITPNITDTLQLHETLKGFLVTDRVPVTELKSDYDNVSQEELVDLTKRTYASIITSDNGTLRQHLDFGLFIMRVRRAFMKNRKRWKVDEQWNRWICRRTKISRSYIYKHIQLTRLCLPYRKLAYLSVPFNYLYQKRQQIIQLFEDYPEIADQWK